MEFWIKMLQMSILIVAGLRFKVNGPVGHLPEYT